MNVAKIHEQVKKLITLQACPGSGALLGVQDLDPDVRIAAIEDICFFSPRGLEGVVCTKIRCGNLSVLEYGNVLPAFVEKHWKRCAITTGNPFFVEIDRFPKGVFTPTSDTVYVTVAVTFSRLIPQEP